MHKAYISDCFAKGAAVPYEFIMSLIKQEIERISEDSKGRTKLILDGFPRNLDQAHSFDHEVDFRNENIVLKSP